MTSGMELNIWLHCVAETLKNHPDWLAPTISAIQSGMNARLDMEISKRSDAEVALAMTYEGIPGWEEHMYSALKESSYKGSTFEKNLKVPGKTKSKRIRGGLK